MRPKSRSQERFFYYKKDGIVAVLWIFETGAYYSCPE